ncbi:MAG: UDP-N-acetylmuramoyl-L-alanyl-D-glutamate--2,6-diaminopimelate ligase [Armatimonadota bacterium]|nr:MAG: UDP-N-acetylmuramoyl-L-alanyl-D-glutamate--2,6-diaminopimelate ligase [Armatimonadota bacterium]
MRNLFELLTEVNYLRLTGAADVPVTGVAYDSRKVAAGDLFACVPGQHTDGHLYISEALARGAAAILAQSKRIPEGQDFGTATVVEVENVRAALAAVSSAFYDSPSRQLCLIGITGTNGKTTTSYLTEAILRQAGYATGVIGTLGYHVGDALLPAIHTTPEAPDLQSLLHGMVTAGVTHAAMEVSSHALALRRADHCAFSFAVFTNLTRDHLDFHADPRDYFEAKARLFYDPLFSPGDRLRINVINADDASGRALAERAVGLTVTYGIEGRGDVMARDVALRADGTSFRVEAPQGMLPVNLKLVGSFNVYNALAALAVALGVGVDLERAVAALESVPPIRGRFERVEAGQDCAVVVDYSHTPDGLEKALRDARRLVSGRLLVVFGAGGDRDPGKRPLMGETAARLADLVFVTSDNPRSESPERIIQQIMSGVPWASRRRCRAQPDRREAIRMALDEARADDLVLIAGKGHETYQIFADRTIHFDDREVVGELVAERGEMRPDAQAEPRQP